MSLQGQMNYVCTIDVNTRKEYMSRVHSPFECHLCGYNTVCSSVLQLVDTGLFSVPDYFQ